jgi:peroxiredoxin
VVVLAINIGDSPEKIRSYFEQNKFTMSPVRQKSNEISKQYGVVAYPTNYVIGTDGKVAYRSVGFKEQALRAALAKAAPAKKKE